MKLTLPRIALAAAIALAAIGLVLWGGPKSVILVYDTSDATTSSGVEVPLRFGASRPNPPGSNGWVAQFEGGAQIVAQCEAGQFSGTDQNGRPICATPGFVGTNGFSQPTDYCGPSPVTTFFLSMTNTTGLIVGEPISVIDSTGNGGWYDILSLADGGVTACLLELAYDSGASVNAGGLVIPNPPPKFVPTDQYTILQYALSDFASPWVNSGNFGPLNMTNTKYVGNVVANVYGLSQGAVFLNGNGGLNTGSATDAGEAATLETGVTMSALVFPTSCASNQTIASKDYYGDGGWNAPFTGPTMFINNSTCGWTASITTGAAQRQIASSFGESLLLNQWNFVAMTYCEPGILRAYVGVTAIKATAKPDAEVDYGTHGQWEIGASTLQPGQGFQGKIAFVRYENVCRTPNYISAYAAINLGQLAP